MTKKAFDISKVPDAKLTTLDAGYYFRAAIEKEGTHAVIDAYNKLTGYNATKLPWSILDKDAKDSFKASNCLVGQILIIDDGVFPVYHDYVYAKVDHVYRDVVFYTYLTGKKVGEHDWSSDQSFGWLSRVLPAAVVVPPYLDADLRPAEQFIRKIDIL